MSTSTSLSGDLRLPTMATWLSRGDALAGAASLDLSGVTHADSAGLAFLLELRRRARGQGRELRFTGAPAQLRQLADFFGLTSALDL